MENLLSSLNVENLVLPAAEEAESIWTKKFGFTKMTEQQVSEISLFGSLLGYASLWNLGFTQVGKTNTSFKRFMHIDLGLVSVEIQLVAARW